MTDPAPSPIELARRAVEMADRAGLQLCEDGDDPTQLFFAHFTNATAATVPDAEDRAYILFACNALPALARAVLAHKPDGWKWTHEHQADLIRRDGLMCEGHPGTEWPHGDCAGPGMPWMIEGRANIERALCSSVAPEGGEASE